MKSPKPSTTCHSFEDLKALLEAGTLPLPNAPKPEVPKVREVQPKMTPEVEEKLFSDAMQGVMPISRENCVRRAPPADHPEETRSSEDAEILSKLTELVERGKGFNVCDTPEYIEGTGYNIHPEVARRLHRGEYSIQAHVDLHGLSAEAAEEVFEAFMKQAVITRKTGVLVVHGRGLSSPSEPVLKPKVVEWLTRGPWRKWVVAYCSARIFDGGAGATYVLLRQRPVSKRQKIKKKGGTP